MLTTDWPGLLILLNWSAADLPVVGRTSRSAGARGSGPGGCRRTATFTLPNDRRADLPVCRFPDLWSGIESETCPTPPRLRTAADCLLFALRSSPNRRSQALGGNTQLTHVGYQPTAPMGLTCGSVSCFETLLPLSQRNWAREGQEPLRGYSTPGQSRAQALSRDSQAREMLRSLGGS